MVGGFVGRGREEGGWQGEEVGSLAGPVDLEEGVVDCMELERLECGKAPPKYIGCPRRSVCFVFTLHE
jgi:hypothetical protein